MDVYIRKVLRVSVAQICQTIGYNSFQSIPLELLVDSLQKFLQEFARDLHRHVELFNRTEANLDDVALSLQSLSISVGDLLEYINNVQPVSCNIEIPQLPAPKSSNLNFLKPGSREVLTRPVHIYEHLPPILRDNDEEDDKSSIVLASPNSTQTITSAASMQFNESPEEVDRKPTGQQIADLNDSKIISGEPNYNSNHSTLDISTKTSVPSSATREISSVMMTSGGFISPAIEGKTPECIIPDFVEKYFGLDAPRPPTPPPPIENIASSSNPGTSASSSIPNPTHSSSTNQNQHPKTKLPSKSKKLNQNTDKKKKIKKKALGGMPPSSLGAPQNALNDKAQRKRFKMLQKSMAKNNSGGTSGNLKSKNHSSLSHGSQEKHLKKQYKLKQKQIRMQSIQKQTESALRAVPNIFGAATDKIPLLPPETEKIKHKKELPAVPVVPSLPEELPKPPNPDVSSSVFGCPPFSNAKEIFQQQQQPLAGLHDNAKGIPPLVPMAHSGVIPSLLQSDEIKLSNEPDRTKLNIFKKISSSGRKERSEGTPSGPNQHAEVKPVTGPSGNTTIFGDSQMISLPSGTTITPAPPSGSGRHVYAPPPSSSQQSGDFSLVSSVDKDGGIPEGSAVLMQRGDLMIQKPKKRGRKPGSKNQPKILGGLPTKKPKKIKKSFFGHHSASNLMEPLNLSHNSIDNIANIPLGIASTFPIDGGVSMKMKKERKKSKMCKESGFMHNHSKSFSSSASPGGKNMAPTKEEFGTINQKLLMMNTVLQAAPPLQTINNLSAPSKGPGRSNSPLSFSTGSISGDTDSAAMRAKKERKKQKQIKDQQKQIMQQGAHQFGSHQSASQHGRIGRSPSPYSTPNFHNGMPGMDAMPMFPFYPFPARPGLIPSHNLFSQLPNMSNNGLFMPPLMGFPPLNQSIRSFFKDDKTNAPPLQMAPEGNYSKVAPLVPDTMKLELSPGAGGSVKSIKNISPRGGGQVFNNPSESMSLLSPGHVGVIRKRLEEQTSSANMNLLKQSETIEVSSDDSVQDEIRNQPPMTPFKNRPAIPLTGIPSGLYRQSRNEQPQPPAPNNNTDVNIFEEIDRSSSVERRNKEHKKVKKIGKQGKKQSPASGASLSEFKNPIRFEPNTGGEAMDMSSESGRKNEESANSSGHTAFDFEASPERRKDHKKMKKLLKETKVKKKKDKKDKSKSKEKNPEKILKSEKSEKEKRKEEKKDKDKLKKLKKDKKKGKEEKERADGDAIAAGGAVKYTSSGGEGAGSSTEVSSIIPKITLKLGQSGQSPTSLKTGTKSSLMIAGFNLPEREQSPELARISPLVTRPPKQHKSGIDDIGSSIANVTPGAGQGASHQIPSLSASLNILNDSVIDIDSNSGGPSTFMLPASATILGGLGMPQPTSKSPASSSAAGGSAFHSASGSGSHQHATSSSSKHSSAVSLISEANRPTSYVDTSTKDAEGNRVWICPACGKVDDGSPMIGCDGCDAWYHWVCVGILVAPEDNEDWYCRVCIAKKRGVHGGDKKRKRNKKKNTDF